MIPDREYTITLAIKVEAQSENEAIQLAEEILLEQESDYSLDKRVTRTVEEGECVECGGTGEVSTDVGDGEGNTMRGVGTQKCLCRIDDGPDRDDE